MRGLWNWCRLWEREKKNPNVRSKTDSSQRKSAETSKETQPRPSLLPSPLHTPTHTVFAGWGDNNGSWRSRDGEAPNINSFRVMSWMSDYPPLPTLHQYGAADFPCALCGQSHVCNKDGKGPAWDRGGGQGVVCIRIIWLYLNAVFVHLYAAHYMQKYFTLKGEFNNCHRWGPSRFCLIKVQASVSQSEKMIPIPSYFHSQQRVCHSWGGKRGAMVQTALITYCF